MFPKVTETHRMIPRVLGNAEAPPKTFKEYGSRQNTAQHVKISCETTR